MGRTTDPVLELIGVAREVEELVEAALVAYIFLRGSAHAGIAVCLQVEAVYRAFNEKRASPGSIGVGKERDERHAVETQAWLCAGKVDDGSGHIEIAHELIAGLMLGDARTAHEERYLDRPS